MAPTKPPTSAREIRARWGHPIIDADGHLVEYDPLVAQFMRDVAGPRIAEALAKRFVRGGFGPVAWEWYGLSPEQRASRRVVRPGFWALPAENTLDLATASLPGLLHERLDEFGIDFVVLFPSRGLLMSYIPEEELRRGGSRALNHYYAELYSSYSDRIAPVAVIPMTTPEEAIDELDYAVGTLGFKAVVMNHTERPTLGAADHDPYRTWPDGYGLDSAYDYDPVWQRCQELGVAPTFHSIAMGWPDRRSPSSYMFNHIGHFAATAEFLAKSLFLGGATRRFPRLNFGFLEGGVARAASLLSDLMGHWEKRKLPELQRYNPTRVDRPLFDDLIARYGDERFRKTLKDASVTHRAMEGDIEDPKMIDEWRHCRIESAEDFLDLFVSRFFFGCEADDRMNAVAFDRRLNPFGVALNAMFSSDIGHWDVPDMRDVVVEAFEAVEDGLLSESDFADFTFGNVVRFYGQVNPGFFEGTAVASQARAILDANPESK